ncbi:hypothetical protein [Actinoplanes sp. NPDC023714]|uniref:hypothetical protein n=1 Tax=Actinoplanes sp. NPDC023714 TaxID=3154322 RepID=UPI0033C8107A
MTPRTIVLAIWLAALLGHAEPDPRTALLTAALALVWAVPLIRRRRAGRAAGAPAPVTFRTATASTGNDIRPFQG